MTRLAAFAVLILSAAPSAVLAQEGMGMSWDQLPEPTHLRQVLDTDTFLAQSPSALHPGAVPVRGVVVQIGAFREEKNADAVIERVKSSGLHAIRARQGSWYLALMPETEKNSAATLQYWAQRSGYPDAFIRNLR